MSTPNLFSRRKAQPDIPRGDVLLSVDTYAEAQSVVDRLAHADYAVTDIAIVGHDLVTIERVTGRLTYARIALRGVLNGAWFGLFFSLMFSVFNAESSNAIVLPAVVAIGAGVGMLFSLALYSMRRRRHDFSSIQQVLASRYEVIVPAGTLNAAKKTLAESPAPRP